MSSNINLSQKIRPWIGSMIPKGLGPSFDFFTRNPNNEGRLRKCNENENENENEFLSPINKFTFIYLYIYLNL